MTRTSADFRLFVHNAADVGRLDQALHYIQTQMPVNGAPVIELAAQLGIRIDTTRLDNSYYDKHTDAVYWNPTAAWGSIDQQGDIMGVISAASVLLHEFAHAIELEKDNVYNRNETWKNDAERFATQTANSAAEEAGEVTRDHYGSMTPVVVENVTQHTMNLTDATGVWVQMDSNNQFEFGPEYDLREVDWFDDWQAPIFGRPGEDDPIYIMPYSQPPNPIDLDVLFGTEPAPWATLYATAPPGDMVELVGMPPPELMDGVFF